MPAVVVYGNIGKAARGLYPGSRLAADCCPTYRRKGYALAGATATFQNAAPGRDRFSRDAPKSSRKHWPAADRKVYKQARLVLWG